MKRKINRSIRTVLAAAALVAGLGIFGISGGHVYAATVTVTDGPCRIRKEASTSSEAISSVNNGKVLDVVSETTASDGYTWYEVKVEGTTTGYIRADLVSTPDGNVSSSSSSTSTGTSTAAATSTTSTTTTSTTASTSTATDSSSSTSSASEVTDSNVLTATVSADTVTVRESASTKSNKVGSAQNGQEMYVNGEASDSDGKLWYKVSFEADGKTVDGFIRSDFVEVTSTLDDIASEEPAVEETQEPVTTSVSNDYEVKYEANSEGVEEWFLYDHINGTKQSINNIHAVMEQSMSANVTDDSSEVKTMKTVIIIMAVIILLLIIGIAVLLLKLRDNYEDFDDIDDDYDEDEEDEEIEEEEEEEPERPADRRKGRKKGGFGIRRKSYDYEEEEDEDDEEEEEDSEVYTRPVRRASSMSSQSSGMSAKRDEGWSSRSLMDIDDDMEFEFLDLDN